MTTRTRLQWQPGDVERPAGAARPLALARHPATVTRATARLLLAALATVAVAGCESEQDGTTLATSSDDAASLDGTSADGGGDDATTGGSDQVGESAPEIKPFAVCRYTNPFSQGPECKAYTGQSWDAASAEADCAKPIAGAQGELELGGACGGVARLGDCSVVGNEGKDYILTSLGSDSGGCALAKTGCEVFAKGSFNAGPICGGTGGTGGSVGPGGGGTGGSVGPGVFVQPYTVCKEPLAGEPAGQSPGGKVCTHVLISGATEFGRKYQDYASCPDVRTQRPYWPAKPAAVTKDDDPRLQDAAYMAEVEWARKQLEATACVCCHAGSETPNGASNWDIEAKGVWLDGLSMAGLAMMAGLAPSDALGAYPAADNNGYDRATLGVPTTDVPRMQKLLLAEWARRGFAPDDAKGIPPFGGPLVAQLNFAPKACAKGEGLDADGTLRWQGGDARYLYVLDASAKSPGVPPNLDQPAGTLLLIDVASKDKPFASPLAYATPSAPLRQRVPSAGAPPALQSGKSYYLYVLKDVGVPVTRCLFTAP